jgi:hypothetical protein
MWVPVTFSFLHRGTSAMKSTAFQSTDRAIQIVAKTIVRELRSQGFDAMHIMALSTELLGHVSAELKSGGKDSSR